MNKETPEAPATPNDFIREIVAQHQQEGRYPKITTRFPPEPNGYLHIGHAKSICLNFGIAREFGGTCNLRMDDTNPTKEDTEYVESIERELVVNLHAPLVITRLAIPLLKRAPDPRVITTVSLGGIFPLGETPIYTSSKFGLRGAMLAIALDLRGKGILAGSVMPSATDTRMLRQEAIDGGNALQFLDPPQSPDQVARTMIDLLDRPRLEAYPRPSESWLVRVALLVPNALPRLMPLFAGRGERGQASYLADLKRRGLVVERDGVLELVEE